MDQPRNRESYLLGIAAGAIVGAVVILPLAIMFGNRLGL
jgi:gas vesicle protein